jgi:GAF domain-containing protein
MNTTATPTPAPEHVTGIYRDLSAQAQALMAGQRHRVANAANLVALINQHLERINWVGFYFLDEDPQGRGEPVLIVGPFQGKPACVRIEKGQGVCGAAVASGQTQRVADVHAFDGHIACDPQSRSEIVIPVRHLGEIIGVLDIDSPDPDRFDATDQAGLEHVVACYSEALG